MLSHCTLSKDKVPGEAHVPSESGLGKQHMPVQKGLVSTTGSLLVSNSSQVSENVTANADMLGDNYQGRQHAEEQNGSCLLPDLPFISEKRSQYASADADIPHRSQYKQQTLEKNDFHVTMSSPFTSDGDPIKQRTAEENDTCLNQLSAFTPANFRPKARVGVDISYEGDHDQERTPDDSGFCVTPISSSHQRSLTPSVNVEISHEAEHGKTQTPNGNALCLTPASPFTGGQGLPYAPENMPCPGDIWSWRVGRRINRKGFFNDRYLLPPERLRTPAIRPEGFGSKVAVEKYVLSEFPQVDLDEFFSSFSWLVPAEPMFENQVQLLKHNICHSVNTENSQEKHQGEGAPSDVPFHSISRKRKRKPVSMDGFLLTNSSRSKSEKGNRRNRQPRLKATLCTNKRKHEGCMSSDALKFYSRRPKIQPFIASETEKTSHGTHGEQRSKASPMEVQSNRQSCGSRFDKHLPCMETPEVLIVASFNEDSGNIYQEMITAANTESNPVSSHNICTDLILFPTPSCEDYVARKKSVEDGNHVSSAETVDTNQYINSLEDVHAQAGVIGTTSVDNQKMVTASNTESNQVSSHNICADLILFPNPSCRDSSACKASVEDGNHVSSTETVCFDHHINSLEDVHAQLAVLGTASVDNQDMRIIANTKSNQVSSHNICADLIPFSTPSCENSVACEASVKDGNHESSAETVNFDQYINSLEDLLAQPVVPGSTSVDSTEAFNLEKEMAEARAKLSSFFAIDFSVFVSSGMHSELANVLGVLSKDPNLTTDQLVQLKLLEVIPLLRTHYLKEAIAIEEANNFFDDLSNKVAKAHSCKDEYNDFKAKEEHIQEEIDSNSLHLTKIKERIAFLLSQRDEVADTISALKVQRNSLNSQIKDIAEVFLPDIVSRIQMANSKKAEWESKKVKALECQAELNAVFISIKEKTT